MTDYRWHRPEPNRLRRLGGARLDSGPDRDGVQLERPGQSGDGGDARPSDLAGTEPEQRPGGDTGQVGDIGER